MSPFPVLEKPLTFGKNLIRVLADSLDTYMKDLGKNVEKALLGWLSKQLAEFGITEADLPQNANLKEIGGFALKVMGLTWADVMAIARAKLGEDSIEMLSTFYDLAKDGLDKDQGGLLESLSVAKIQEFFAGIPGLDEIETLLTEELSAQKLQDKAIEGAIKGFINTLPPAILLKIPQFLPTPTGLIGLAATIYKGVDWFFKNTKDLTEMVKIATSLADQAKNLVDGNLVPVKAAVLKAMEDASPIILTFVVKIMGMSDIPKKTRNAIHNRREEVKGGLESLLTKLVAPITKKLEKAWPTSADGGLLGNPAADYKGLMSKVQKWKIEDEAHRAWVRRTNKVPELMLASVPKEAKARIKEWRDLLKNASTDFSNKVKIGELITELEGFLKDTFNPKMKGVDTAVVELDRLLAEPDEKKRAKLTLQIKAALLKMQDGKTGLNTMLDQLEEKVKPIQRALETKACFAAGTQLLTPSGTKPVELFRAGDAILSRSEWDPNGPIGEKLVVRVFQRTGRILHLHLRGELIRTTPEHPFYVLGRGWVPAMDIAAGEQLLGRSDEIVTVEEAFDTGEYETVYNVEVADHHTYFVGAVNSGWSIWAHNATKDYYISEDPAKPNEYTVFRKSDGQVVIDFVTGLGFWATSHGSVMDELKKTGASRPGLPLPEKVETQDPRYKTGWEDVLKGADELPATKPENGYNMYDLNPLKFPTNPTNKPAHAHHVVMKRGNGEAGQADSLAAQKILRKNKIDPFFSRMNLYWAPLNIGHSAAYAQAVLTALNLVENNGQAAVSGALKDLAIRYKTGEWYGT